MNTDEKVDSLLGINALLIVVVLISNLNSVGILLPGDAEDIISTSDRDLRVMAGMYNRLAESHNNGNVYQLPFFNESRISENQVNAYISLGQRDTNRLTAYKNEATLRFDIAYYDAAGSNSTMKVANAYLVLMDAAARERALQKAANDKIDELKGFILAIVVISVLGFMLIKASVYLKQRRVHVNVNEWGN